MSGTGPNLRHLSGIAAIAAEGTLSAAAAHINLSQPALTQGLARIEGALGTPLFRRTADGMVPTEAGHLYLARLERGFGFLRRAARGFARPHVWRTLGAGQLRAVIAAVDHGGFRPAAVALGRQVSTISRTCREVERIAGIPLFEQTSQGLRPTRQAESVARHARLALREFEQAEHDVTDREGRFGGRLDIGCLPLAQTALLPEALCRFGTEFPGIAPRVTDGLYRALAQDLLRGALDLIVGALRTDDLPEGLRQEALFDDPLWVVARPGHPLEGRRGVDTAQLSRFAWVAPRAGAPARTHFTRLQDRLTAPAGLPRPIETGAPSVMTQLLVRSDRLTLISAAQVRSDIAAGRLVRIDADLPPGTRPIGVTSRADWAPSVPQQRFVALLREVVAETRG
ncbi:LysR family transcriptional regulator [Roseivivax sediminis]|uniref:DNA-binding transcriptional regulator, LysR family n=1 Tax=Roseivivax sediminis TaxID=936889 RepID=A0A1I1UVZ8_9RHOB|nr:LysR family transcriptional regulator [Roseivivax sediminis]SFD72190.1 DNA-binding transcriptional regulator, LysR family [Roseivivax sediminis]